MSRVMEDLGQLSADQAKHFLLDRMQTVENIDAEEQQFLASEIADPHDLNLGDKREEIFAKGIRMLGGAFAADVHNANDFRSVRAQYRAAVASLRPSDVLFHVAHQTRLGEEEERQREKRRRQNRFLLTTLIVAFLAGWFVFAVVSGKFPYLK